MGAPASSSAARRSAADTLAGEQDDLVAQRLEQPGERHGVLACQQVRGRQQRGLPAGIGHERHGERRDRGLARADVALDQPHHRAPGAEVGADRPAPRRAGRR